MHTTELHTTARTAGAPAEASRRRVLVVEDDYATRRLMTVMLEERLEVVAVATYDEALQAVASHRFDLVVLDIVLLSEHTGIDALRALRSHPKHTQVPALACTATASSTVTAQCQAAGFDAFLWKPFTRGQLFEAIGTALHARPGTSDEAA